jgi:uncharacterized membrane protein
MRSEKTVIHIATVMLLLLVLIPAGLAAPEYTITYSVTITGDGAATWQVEYRTLLATDDDEIAFDTYAKDIDTIYLPQFKELMLSSVAQASVATSRHMDATDFSANAVVQASPTGKYGVITYAFTWTGFAKPGKGLTIGDAFAGGLYLTKDATLIVRYPVGYSVVSVDPAPHQDRNELIWYGQQSFGAGEPRIVLEPAAFPILPLAGGIFVLAIILIGGLIFYRHRKQSVSFEDSDSAQVSLSEAEIMSLEERVLQIIRSAGGEMYQSEIVKNLGLPKSTVSTVLNALHERGIIIKVKKGRENLIRLI